MGISLEYLLSPQDDWLDWCNDQRDKESDNYCLIICSQAQWLSDHWLRLRLLMDLISLKAINQAASLVPSPYHQVSIKANLKSHQIDHFFYLSPSLRSSSLWTILMSHKIPKLNSHVHSTRVPNYNLSHSSPSSCTKIPSHALLNLQLLSFCPCFPFSPFIFHTTGPISQIVNASKTGTIDYTLDTNVTLPDETRQTSCQIICSLTQFGFREHFVHRMSPKMS